MVLVPALVVIHRVALNLLSSSFLFSLCYCFQQVFLLAATRPGSLFSFVLFFQLKSPVERALLKVLYHPVYLLIHNFKFLRKSLHNF